MRAGRGAKWRKWRRPTHRDGHESRAPKWTNHTPRRGRKRFPHGAACAWGGAEGARMRHRSEQSGIGRCRTGRILHDAVRSRIETPAFAGVTSGWWWWRRSLLHFRPPLKRGSRSHDGIAREPGPPPTRGNGVVVKAVPSPIFVPPRKRGSRRHDGIARDPGPPPARGTGWMVFPVADKNNGGTRAPRLLSHAYRCPPISRTPSTPSWMRRSTARCRSGISSMRCRRSPRGRYPMCATG